MNSLASILNKINIFGERKLMTSCLPYYLLPLLFLLAIKVILTDAWIIAAILYIIMPIFDEIFTLDLMNPTQAQNEELKSKNAYFQLSLYICIVLDWVIFLKVMNHVKNLESFSLNLLGLFFVFFNIQSLQTGISHQIYHKQGKWNKVITTIHLIKTLYMHFPYQHSFGHHRRVSTPSDPASADQGVTFYQFLPRSYLGQYKSVYYMQKDEEKKPFYLNIAVLSIASAIVFISVICYFFGPLATIFFIGAELFAITFLEATNYIEHYGLRRQKLPNGEYQKVNIRHSWNAAYRFSNYFFFKVQRHSDHHENSLKPYQSLLSLDESPHLPHGYTLMIMMSFFPKIWFRIMDPVVQQYRKTGMGIINSEVTRKAAEQTKKFSNKLTIGILSLSALMFIL